jgi:hypothetical protein
MPHDSSAFRRTALQQAALALCLVSASAVHAEDRPYYIGVSQTFTHESNVFRSRTDEVDDIVSSTGVLGGLDLTLGRQRVYLDASANDNRHDERSELDNTSYSVNTGLNWETIERLSGTVRYSTRQNLTDFGIIGSPRIRNVVRMQHFSANARYGFVTRFGLEGGVERRNLDYSASDERDNTQDVARLGVRWGGGGQLSLGLGARVTKGETPRYQALENPNPLDPDAEPQFGPVQPDEMDRKDVDLTATWTPTGLSTINARLSATDEEHTVESRPSFSGLTGSLTWNYQPSDKLTTAVSLIRDTGNETTFIQGGFLGRQLLQIDTNRLNTVGLVEAAYEATAKISLDASIRHTRGVVTTVSGREFGSDATEYGLGARYEPIRSVTLGCRVSHQTRNDAYDATTTSCFGQFTLR